MYNYINFAQMEIYDYLEAVKEDVKNYIEKNGQKRQTCDNI